MKKIKHCKEALDAQQLESATLALADGAAVSVTVPVVESSPWPRGGIPDPGYRGEAVPISL